MKEIRMDILHSVRGVMEEMLEIGTPLLKQIHEIPELKCPKDCDEEHGCSVPESNWEYLTLEAGLHALSSMGFEAIAMAFDVSEVAVKQSKWVTTTSLFMGMYILGLAVKYGIVFVPPDQKGGDYDEDQEG